MKNPTIRRVEFINTGATLTLLSCASVFQLETVSQSLPSIILLPVASLLLMAQHFDEPPKREKPQPVMSINVECRLEGQPVHDEAVTRGKSTVSRSDGDSRGLVTKPLKTASP